MLLSAGANPNGALLSGKRLMIASRAGKPQSWALREGANVDARGASKPADVGRPRGIRRRKVLCRTARTSR